MIDKDSRGAVAIIYLFSIAVGFVFVRYVRITWLVWPMLALLVWFCVWQTTFFRVPRRRRKVAANEVTSVADGKVVFVGKTTENEMLGKECIQISVYMNFFDVHANFWPVDGTVTGYKYYPGLHLLAFKPKASLDNEHTCVRLATRDGKEVMFKQIAGGFARRIVCYAEDGLQVKAGEQCGIIKFGSRIDIFLPCDVSVKVSTGDYVHACKTVLAKL